MASTVDPYAPPRVYYGENNKFFNAARKRSHSATERSTTAKEFARPRLKRQASHVDVDALTQDLLAAEDTDNNEQVTVEDGGPKSVAVPTARSGGVRRACVSGTYAVSNLLQELATAAAAGRREAVLAHARLAEDPVRRLCRRIEHEFWDNLTRRIDAASLAAVARDPKDWTATRARIYVPQACPEQYAFYTRIAQERPEWELEICLLPEDCDDPDYVRDLNEAPGLLAIEVERIEDRPDGQPDYRGVPYVVPGGRFMELYGWDSNMESKGLSLHGRTDLVKAMVKHFCFSIRHYGKILNANRTYYLCRSQPPFLTDMALQVYDRTQGEPDRVEFLRRAVSAAIKDYHKNWMSQPRLDPVSGLSRYRPDGRGVPPETESTHFLRLIRPYAVMHNMTHEEFIHAYNHGLVSEPELDEFFRHDRAVRESGHDTTYRLESVAADLATVDLNAALYRIERDIARVVEEIFSDAFNVSEEFRIPGQPAVESSAAWLQRAELRRQRMEQLMWDEEQGVFFDYNTASCTKSEFVNATVFWALWAGVATRRQAELMVAKALPQLEQRGGLASGTEQGRGEMGIDRPMRQWDFPFGWAPHQILAWEGLARYGFHAVVRRLAYRWTHMMTMASADFNGVVVEKYDVTSVRRPHHVDAEYGNQGADFKRVANEGFGWVNASYVLGLEYLNAHMKRALSALVPWDDFDKATKGRYSSEDVYDSVVASGEQQ